MRAKGDAYILKKKNVSYFIILFSIISENIFILLYDTAYNCCAKFQW